MLGITRTEKEFIKRPVKPVKLGTFVIQGICNVHKYNIQAQSGENTK